MEKIANRLTDYLVRTQTVREDNRDIYVYGFQISLEVITGTLTIILSAVIMGMFVECVFLLAVFFAIRGVAGGIHMKSFIACYLCSEVLMVLALAAIKYLKFEMNVITGISISSLVIIKYLSPVENADRPVCDWERKMFGKRLNIIIAILVVLESILYLTDQGYRLWNMAVGELLIVLTLAWGRIRYRRAR